MSEIVLTSREKGWYHWAVQFSKASPKSSYVAFNGSKPGRTEILRAYKKAASQVGPTDQLIISAGHGFSGGASYGVVDLAPGGSLRLSSAHFRMRGRLLNSTAKNALATYDQITKIIRPSKVKRVLFLSCNVGNAWDFLQQFADDWQATIFGYRDILVPGYVKNNRTKKPEFYYIYLSKEEPRTHADRVYLSKNYPIQKPSNAWRFLPRKSP